MPRIQPLQESKITEQLTAAYADHVHRYNARITNMKATLGHSVEAFEVYMQWYPLYEKTKEIAGERMAYLFAYTLSTGLDCPLCSTFFRKIIMEAGENPEDLKLSDAEQELISFGAAISANKGIITDEVYDEVAKRHTENEMVILIAFAGQMIATNIFNNVIETDIDEYLAPYLPPKKIS
jgi:hypothetical protein